MTEKMTPDCSKKFNEIENNQKSLKSSIEELSKRVKDFSGGFKAVIAGDGKKEGLAVRLDRLERFADDLIEFRKEIQKSVIQNIVRVAFAAIVSFLLMAATAIYTIRTNENADKAAINTIVKEIVKEIRNEENSTSATRSFNNRLRDNPTFNPDNQHGTN